MQILILGGTRFLGRALTDAALDGHGVTHFNRGRSGVDPRVETVIGDRTASLEALSGRRWDAVIDTSGYLPQVVDRSAAALRPRARSYLFVSSISVFASFAEPGIDEDAAVLAPPDPLPDAMTWENYGALKAGCESRARAHFGDDALVVRPGLIVGPHDGTDRFTYWPHRVARGGRVAAPVRASYPVQCIDVRDLAAFMVALLEGGTTGVFNATSPPGAFSLGDVLAASREAASSDAMFEWIAADFLAAHGVKPWSDMPLYVGEEAGMRGFASVCVARALAAGLRLRPLRDTVSDTLAWSRTRPAGHVWKAGLAPERERELLAAWDAR